MTNETPELNPDIPQTARIWNYWLGGKDNFAVDRQVGEDILKVLPNMALFARATRQFLQRAVHHLAADLGVTQFLDVGTGLPTADNTHQVAQRAVPTARVVYVDNDPLVLTHARALLTGTPEGRTAYLNADLREPEKIIEQARETLDFDKPIALLLMGILGHITEDAEARSIVTRLLADLPSGSYLALYDATNVIDPASAEAIEIWNRSAEPPYVLRSPAQLESFFEGLELLPPGVVSCPLWKPEDSDLGAPEEIDEFCGVARKP
ncbi:SAM-dependent methyltransferase [Actinocorallia sp. API 0066]|uniref:SAM-dependent methyltransferase n=1 Tax=Actinocorallia sp. API 0066 TaxID=2896846 RepID=UPI001E4679B4|nr:SAM-dependent methyltransferase [Actinocorallia sp. API 0066]MCD0448926.1 SAM-dependent methyltransferase [Actinocorallia sp. API 0066]